MTDDLNKKVLVCVGSGGVGKTTLSASLAVQAAKSGKKVLVMTIDPSQRLKSALGLKDGEFDLVKVPGQNYPGELFANLLNAEHIFREFIEKNSEKKDLADRLLQNRLYKQLSTTLSGSQEFTSLLQLSKLAQDSKYDLVILDTPPAQHAIDFLEAPEKLSNLFKENVIRWFLGPQDESNFFRRMISRSTVTVLSALERITGSAFMTELYDFFRSVRAIQQQISIKNDQVRALLKDDETAFILVTAYDEAKLEEARRLREYLVSRSYNMSSIFINRSAPAWISMDIDSSSMPSELQEEYERWRSYFSSREKHYREFMGRWDLSTPVFLIPELSLDLTGLEALEAMNENIHS